MTWPLVISLGEALAGVLSVIIGLSLVSVALGRITAQQRLIRLWIGAYCLVMGLEEVLDAFFTEGDAAAFYPQVICTLVQLVTSAGAVHFMVKISRRAW